MSMRVYTSTVTSDTHKEHIEDIYARVMARILPISLQQYAAMHVSNDSIVFSYTAVAAKVWKLILWNIHTRKEGTTPFLQHVGGGIESPIFTFGHYREQGAYTYFGDITKTTAWDTTIHQYTKWVIRNSPVRRPALGGMISLPYSRSAVSSVSRHDPVFSIWGGMIPDPYSDDMKDAYSHVGASLGYKFWGWEPRLLYKRSHRSMLPLQSYRWDRWTITLPTALTIHQIMLSQKIKLSRFFLADMVIRMSHTDTYMNAFSGKTMMRWMFLNFELACNVSLSHSHAINDEWKYNNYIWNVSMEFLWFYISHAHIRLRSEIAEYNPRTAVSSVLDAVKRMYYVEWRQNFLYDHLHSSLESVLGYDYVRAQDYEYHRSKVDITFTHGLWMRKEPPVTTEDARVQALLFPETAPVRIGEFDHRVLHVLKYYVNDMSGVLKKIDMAQTFSSKMKLSAFPISFFTSYKMNMTFDMKKQDTYIDTPWHVVQDITATLGSHVRIQGLYIPIKMMCIVKFHDTYSYEDAYTVHWKFELKIQYNW